jgi:hypothetical protein
MTENISHPHKRDRERERETEREREGSERRQEKREAAFSLLHKLRSLCTAERIREACPVLSPVIL